MQAIVMAAMLALQGAPTADPAPLAPSGKWVVNYADKMCVLSRDFGSGDSAVTFGVRPWPLGVSTDIVLITKGDLLSGRSGAGSMISGPDGAVVEGHYFGFPANDGLRRVTVLTVSLAELAGLETARTLTVKIGRTGVTMAPSGMKAALAALKTCSDDLLEELGEDPALQATIVQPAEPIGSPADWITNNDYPADALRRSSSGRTVMIWTVGVDGLVSNCINVWSSGDPSLDAAACQAITRGGRYRPARDKDGKPVASRQSRAVMWAMP